VKNDFTETFVCGIYKLNHCSCNL